MKTNLDKFFKTDETLEQKGVWFEIADGVRFLVRPMKATNPQIKAAVATYYKPHAQQVEKGTIDPKKVEEIQIKVFVKACLVDWEGIEIDGQVTPYSPDIAIEFFKNLPELFWTLFNNCNDYKNYQAEVVGNS